MKKYLNFFALAALLVALPLSFARAEDVDIFLTKAQSSTSKPNVLLVLDNASSNNGSVTLLDGTKGDKLEMLRQVLNVIIDPTNTAYAKYFVGSSIEPAEVDKLLSGINLGLMIANPSVNGKGGYVRYHVSDMGSGGNRTAILGKINPSIPQANNAPYAKSMHEAYLYYGGKTPYVGFDSTAFDPRAKSQTDPSKYASPAIDSCQSNYVVFVGNGGPDSGEETDTKTLLAALGGTLSSDPVKFTPNNLTSSWFDEYARTLKSQDVVPALEGVQNVTTYTIAVQNPDDKDYKTNPVASARALLNSAAFMGGGEFFLASNAVDVMKAFINLLSKFQAVDSVFAASTLPVSVNVRGTFLNQVYMGQFRPDEDAKPRWPGNLKQYKIALNNGSPILADRFGKGIEDTVNGFILPDKTSYWTQENKYWTFGPMGSPKSSSDGPDGNVVEKGGAAQRMRSDLATSQDARKLYTCNGACTPGAALSSTLFNDANTGITFTGLDATERKNLINWVRGADNMDNEDGNGVDTDVRARIHGDLLHSRPAVVNYNRNYKPATSSTPAVLDERDVMVYYGTNGGIFHAVKGGQDDADGGEKWGMVFPEHWDRLKRLRDNSPEIQGADTKPYFADGPISIYQNDVNGDGRLVAADGDKVYLYIGMRRGGEFAYALDVSDPDTPKFLWKITSADTAFKDTAGNPTMGQTWSTMRPAKIRASTNHVVVMGAGYDAATEDPTPASYVPAATSPNNKGRGIYVINGVDGTLIKHINVTGMGSMAADLTVIDRNNDGYFDRIYAADTKGNIWRVDIDNADPSKWAVVQLASLGGTSGTASGRKFLNKPDVVFGADFDAVLVGSGDREQPFETTVANRFYMVKDKYIGLTGGFICSSVGVGRACEEADLYAVTGTYATDKSATITNGWYKALRTGEKTVGNAVTVGGMTYFGTNTPIAATSGVCSSNLGEARLYSVNFQNATPPVSMNKDSTTTVLADYIAIPGGGFPPSPVYARVIVDGKPVDVLCTGSKCLPPPGVTTTSKRSRTYWYTKR